LGSANGVAGGRQTIYTLALSNVRFMFDYLHGNIAKQISPTNSGDAGANSTHSRCARRSPFDEKDEIVMGTVAAEIPVQTRRDPSLLQMAHPVEAALCRGSDPTRPVIGSTPLGWSVLSVCSTLRLFDCFA
jgi:hypothetical protein